MKRPNKIKRTFDFLKFIGDGKTDFLCYLKGKTSDDEFVGFIQYHKELDTYIFLPSLPTRELHFYYLLEIVKFIKQFDSNVDLVAKFLDEVINE